MCKPRVIGVTGKIATGKTYFCRLFQKTYPDTKIFNADEKAKKLLKENKNLQSFIIEILGAEILDTQTHHISHEKLAKKIFASEKNYQAIVPKIWEETEKKLCEFLSSSDFDTEEGRGSFFLIESALLLGAGWGKYCDKILLLCPKKDLHQQYLSARNLSEEEVFRCMKFQHQEADRSEDVVIITEEITGNNLLNIRNRL